MRTAAAIFLCFLISQVDALLYTDAKCVAGYYDWTYSSTGQSPCDVAADLAAACVDDGKYNLEPLAEGYVYSGPPQNYSTPCRCSSVFYSLLSACAYCQGRNYLRWSHYSTNCSTTYVTVYNHEIPTGVKVPPYAYQNVSIPDTWNVTVAQSMKGGVESSRAASPAATGT